MVRWNIPTARHRNFTDHKEAVDYLRVCTLSFSLSSPFSLFLSHSLSQSLSLLPFSLSLSFSLSSALLSFSPILSHSPSLLPFSLRSLILSTSLSRAFILSPISLYFSLSFSSLALSIFFFSVAFPRSYPTRSSHNMCDSLRRCIYSLWTTPWWSKPAGWRRAKA